MTALSRWPISIASTFGPFNSARFLAPLQPFMFTQRHNRNRTMPPEFRKKYVPLTNQQELDAFGKGEFGGGRLSVRSRNLAHAEPESSPRLRNLYQELVPHNVDPRYRDRLRERLERREMMLRRRHLHIPEFFVGSILAVTVADQFAPNLTNRFVGICIERLNEGLWTKFTLRNVIEQTAVEIRYELYNPTIQAIEVLILQKRLDTNLLYLRDAPLAESCVPFDLTPVPRDKDKIVPVNEKMVKLLRRPWQKKWQLHGYRGIDSDSLYGQLTPKELTEIEKSTEFVDRYDLMKIYRSRCPPAERNVALAEVQLQHDELIRHSEMLRQQRLRNHRKQARQVNESEPALA